MADTTHSIARPRRGHGDSEGVTRRDFLLIATGAFAAVGAAATIWPFIDQMNPDAAALALASIEVDISPIEQGQSIIVKWRGKPVVIRYRTEKEMQEAQAGLARRAQGPDRPQRQSSPPTRRRPTPTARSRARKSGW